MHGRTTKQGATGARWIWGAALFGLLLPACNPSPRFDPDPPTGAGGTAGTGGTATNGGGGNGGDGGTVTTTSSGGGGSTAGCKSNADCTFPDNLCDIASGDCVECLVTDDCGAKPGTVCSMASCVCPVVGETFCPADGYGSARCADLDASTNDCGSCGHQCFGACAAGACTDAWEPTAAVGAPSPRAHHVAVWTGSRMIVWGGENGAPLGDGALYDPATRTWTPMSDANVPSPRSFATAVWTGAEMIVWGGRGPGGAPLADGRKYDPMTNTWSNVETGGPAGRYQHTAVWTTGAMPDRMIVWGGFDGGTELGSGAYYTGSTWTEGGLMGTPSQRRLHTVVWDDAAKRMIMFGGLGLDPGSGTTTSLATLAVYGPLPNSEVWTEIGPSGTPPAPRYEHSAVWATDHMIVWGGFNAAVGLLNDGALFDVLGISEWQGMNGVPPSARRRHSAVYFKNLDKMVVWGGYGAGGVVLDDGGVFSATTGEWSAAGLPQGPLPSVDHTAVVAGSRMIVWGGITAGGGTTNKGAVLDMSKVP
jgi:hypothetical protein